MAYASEVTFNPNTLGERVRAFGKAWAERRAHARMYRQTLNELRVLSDRDLADLGISRTSIPFIAKMSVNTQE